MNDNENNSTEGANTPRTAANNNVLNLEQIRKARAEGNKEVSDTVKKSSIRSGTFELHLFPIEGQAEGEVLTATGYLKFGPQFIAVVEGKEDESQLLFCLPTHLVRYIRMQSEAGSHTEATLDLN